MVCVPCAWMCVIEHCFTGNVIVVSFLRGTCSGERVSDSVSAPNTVSLASHTNYQHHPLSVSFSVLSVHLSLFLIKGKMLDSGCLYEQEVKRFAWKRTVIFI